jgi:hypothetical protein
MIRLKFSRRGLPLPDKDNCGKLSLIELKNWSAACCPFADFEKTKGINSSVDKDIENLTLLEFVEHLLRY